MSDIQDKVWAAWRWKIILRLSVLLLLAAGIGSLLNRIASSLDGATRPAGFSRGMVQGALMPMSMPNLLFGKDVTIYSQTNTELTYKLGYTTGVNGCGAIFFGVFFWRIARWSNLAAPPRHESQPPEAENAAKCGPGSG